MSNNFILVLTGPAGAGKTTLGTSLSKKFKNCAHVDADYVKHFIVNGFIYDETTEGIMQWELLGKNLGMLAKNFNDAGYNLIINGYISVAAWRVIESFVRPTHKVLLLPNVDTVVDRDSKRAFDMVMGEKAVKEHHEHFSSHKFFADFIKIDSTNHSIEETEQKITMLLENWG